MPEKYTVKITAQAQEQLREIISYISYTLSRHCHEDAGHSGEGNRVSGPIPQPCAPYRRGALAQSVRT